MSRRANLVKFGRAGTFLQNPVVNPRLDSMAKRTRRPPPSPSDDDDGSIAFSQDVEPVSQALTQSTSQESQRPPRKPRSAAVAAAAKRRAAQDDEDSSTDEPKDTKKPRRGTVTVKSDDIEFDFEEQVVATTVKKVAKAGGKKLAVEATVAVSATAVEIHGKDIPATPGKRKAKAKAGSMTPLARRTAGCAFKLGAHVAAAGGVENAVTNAVHIGANAFALFLKSQRKWESPAYKAANVEAFRRLTKQMDYDPRKHMLPHGSYLVNLAQPDKEKAGKAYANFVDDLKRAEALDIGLFNFHSVYLLNLGDLHNDSPGSTLDHPRNEAIGRIAAALNKAHKETKFVKTVLETMAGQGNVIGNKFEDLRDIINLVKDKSRVGVCIDTCHSFSAGYDLRSPETYRAVMKEFDDVIGFKYLSALHLNDSKAPFNSHRDLHQNIGLGFLGLSAFRNIMNTTEFHDIPMVLETPLSGDDVSVWAGEIKLLEKLVGLAPDDPEFLALEKEYADKGAAERAEVMEKVGKKAGEKEAKEVRKREKEEKKAAKEREKEEKKAAKERVKSEKARKGGRKGAGGRKAAVKKEEESASEGEESSCGSNHGDDEDD
ncbi:LOW QUALITY PROTEIN: hypothetical protein Dda_3437 [Drechslerella dactyloides]|uniref:Apurinic-apyrimidinic endonuclease 1 n=1 Tax=Drechslerella dactyloides TaxID=74499 RepID=A0AAD6J1J7_DREDA|nr:LOW QUALITY PROTEIN: hypothetical protein Dda_3437 [Drechslerella dactyloides]